LLTVRSGGDQWSVRGYGWPSTLHEGSDQSRGVTDGASKRLGEVLRQGGTTKLPARHAGERAGGPTDWPDHYRLTTAEAEIASARAALCTVLEGFGVGVDQRRDLLVERLLPGALAAGRDQPRASAGECATLYAEQEFEIWLTHVLGADRLAGQPALPIGRAAFLACGGPTAWPDLLLVDEALPEAFVAAMRAAAPVLLPIATPGAMAAQSLEAWSIADAGRAVAEIVDGNLAWLTHARPLIAAPIRLTRTTS
jgi:hypothetical protein